MGLLGCLFPVLSRWTVVALLVLNPRHFEMPLHPTCTTAVLLHFETSHRSIHNAQRVSQICFPLSFKTSLRLPTQCNLWLRLIYLFPQGSCQTWGWMPLTAIKGRPSLRLGEHHLFFFALWCNGWKTHRIMWAKLFLAALVRNNTTLKLTVKRFLLMLWLLVKT